MNKKQASEIARSVEKKVDVVPTAICEYKSLVVVKQEEIRQSGLKHHRSAKRKPRDSWDKKK